MGEAAAGLVAYRLSEDVEQWQVPIRERLASELAIAAAAVDSGTLDPDETSAGVVERILVTA